MSQTSKSRRVSATVRCLFVDARAFNERRKEVKSCISPECKGSKEGRLIREIENEVSLDLKVDYLDL